MNNFDIYQLLNFIVNKDVYAQAIGPPEMELELKSKNLVHFRARLGLPETYIPGSANEGAGVTAVVEKDLLPFLVEATNQNPVNGIVVLDDWYFINDFYTATSITTSKLKAGEISSRQNNYITKPTIYHIAGEIVPTGIRVYPATLTGVTVSYYKQPKDPVFQIITDPLTLEMTYDTVNSVELEWDDMNKLSILVLILQDLGLNVERQDVLQAAAKMIQTGK